MPTPHADRLHGIESWSPSSIQDSFGYFADVSAQLRFIADNNRRIVADLGMEGQTADAARRYFDRVATKLYDQANKIDQMARVVKDVMNGGIEAKNHSIELQARLAQVNQFFGKAEKTIGLSPGSTEVLAQLSAKRDAMHAEIDRRAKEVLHTLNVRTLNGIASLPYQEHLRQELKSSNPALIERLERHEAAQRHGPATGNRGASPGSAVASGPARSATAWHTPGRDVSLGSPGSHTAPGGGGSHSPGDVGLQSSHYTPVQSGTVGSSSVPGSDLGVLNPGKRVSAVHDHLAAAAAAAGGPAAVLGYRAYRAARAAAAAKSAPVSSSPARSGAAIRSAPPAKTSGLLRGATTAARATTPTTPASSAGRGVRGGATGAARPVPSSSQGRPPVGLFARGNDGSARQSAGLVVSRFGDSQRHIDRGAQNHRLARLGRPPGKRQRHRLADKSRKHADKRRKHACRRRDLQTTRVKPPLIAPLSPTSVQRESAYLPPWRGYGPTADLRPRRRFVTATTAPTTTTQTPAPTSAHPHIGKPPFSEEGALASLPHVEQLGFGVTEELLVFFFAVTEIP